MALKKKKRLPELGSSDTGYFLCCIFPDFHNFHHDHKLLVEPGGEREWPPSSGPQGAGLPKPVSVSGLAGFSGAACFPSALAWHPQGEVCVWL